MFVQDCCERGEDHKVRGSTCYEAYKNWATANGYKVMASRRVKHEWERLGFTHAPEKSGNFYRAVKLILLPPLHPPEVGRR